MKKIMIFILAMLFCCNLHSEMINWTAPVLLSNAGEDATEQQIAIDVNGNIAAVWIENGFVMFSQKPVGGSWSLPATTISSFDASEPQLVIDSTGKITALWLASGVVKTASKTIAGSWGSTTALSAAGASTPQLGVDASGNCVAIWNRQGTIESSTRLAAGSWQVIPDILSISAGSNPQISIGSNGAITAVWHGLSIGKYAIFSSNKDYNGSWSLPAQIISTGSQDNQFPKVTVSDNGAALAVWYNCNLSGSTYTNVTLQCASCPYQGAWTTPETLINSNISTPNAIDTKVLFCSKGDAIVLWKTVFVGDYYGVKTLVRNSDATWETATDLVIANLYAYAADVAVTSRGEAYVAYMYSATPGDNLSVQITEAHIAAYDNTYWSVPTTLSTGTINGYPKVAASLTGNTINSAALWQNYNDVNKQLYVSTGSGTVILPPTNLSVTQTANNEGLFTEYYNTITWQASPSQATTAYIIFRNGELFSKVPANVLQVIDHNTGLNQPVTYGIAALDGQDAQSETATVSFPAPGIIQTVLDSIGSLF